ncbi:Crp/Fnr family transcriptional regulator [Allomuricauda sp. SCSIO 65647]|uniref:Crp/Fnr family transcriptional regulator n=1 Tax=Allomuricauda sp. SCSIO 65647 TaxID=2908843 RepID=UPI001F175988|nr:Crp/Fnr family transcriptional regulator [Muricauda sp. SCSIO 65647]UJH66735.1 Crp/Fnr family transcriptional regulator [Muricauda sp. SCSIO 65647]
MGETSITSFFEFESAKEPLLKEEILKVGNVKSFKKGELLIREGQYLKVLPIVLKGSIRVFQTHEDREILLYYVQPQETCIMSLAACLFNNESPSYAITEEETDVLFIPSSYIPIWQRKYMSWNKFVLKSYRNRYDELLDSFNDVVFKKIDERVISYFHEYASNHNTNKIPLSHQALAHELGTTRVVISRILKNFETQGKVVLHRGFVELKK